MKIFDLRLVGWAILLGFSTSLFAQTSQTITFDQPLPKQNDANPFTLSATASSGLPVSFSILAGPATVSGATVTITGVGAVTVKASQAGNASFLPAPDVLRSFAVGPAIQFTKVVSGMASSHTLALKADGTLWAWGDNGNNRLGDTGSSRFTPTQIGTASNWSDIATGGSHSLGLRTDGTMWAWGNNANGQLGDGTTTSRSTPAQIGSGNIWTAIAAGNTHSAAVKDDGTLWVWGSNGNGQLGDGTTMQSLVIKQVGTATDWRSVACGNGFTHAVKTSNQLWAWGLNGNGQLGIGSTTQQTSPIRVGTASDWSVVSCGNNHTAAIKTTGQLWAWGLNSSGQVGDASTTQRTAPVQVGADLTWTVLACGGVHTAASKSDGSLWAWGSNVQGALADGTVMNRTAPTRFGTANDWSAVTCGINYTTAMRSDGSVWAAGDGTGFMGPSPRALALAAAATGTLSSITTDFNAAHLLKMDGTLWGWGLSGGGGLGDGTSVDKRVLTQIGVATDWVQVSDGANGHSLAIKNGGELWVWGANGNGQLGLNDTATRSGATRVGTESTWAKVSAGSSHSLAVKTDGTLWAWGGNSNGQLGDGTLVQKNVPTQIGTDTDWAAVFGGYSASYAIKTNGTLWAWGSNGNGRLGDGTTTQQTAPVQIGSATDWLRLSASNHVLALKTDGTLWSWGLGSSGQLSSGATSDRTSPVQIGTSTDWTQFAAGADHSLAVKSDGTLWICGRGLSGQLGNSSIANVTTFTQMGTDKRWQYVAAGSTQSLATRADSTIWGAGAPTSGRLMAAGRSQLVMAPVLPPLSPQTVSAPATASVLGAPFKVTSTSGYASRVELISGPATVSGDTVTLTGQGTVELSASQFGDETAWNAAVPTLLTVTANSALSVSFASNATVGHTQNGFDATTSGIDLSLGFAPSVGNVLTLVDNTGLGAITGTFPGLAEGSTVNLSYNGTAYAFQLSYLGGDGNDITLTSILSPQTLTFEQPTPKLTTAAPFNLVGSSTSGLPVTFSIIAGPATVAGSTVTLTGAAGAVTVKVSQAGNANFLPAAEVVQTFVVSSTVFQFTKIVAATGANHTLALKADGTLWSWGNNSNGQLGDGGTTSRLAPIQVGPATTWSDIAVGASHSLALRSDGSLWAWGLNTNGQLGDGTTTQRSVPTQVGSGSVWTSIGAGGSHSAAVKSDGTLWSWGLNGNGQLGDNSTTQSLTIKQTGTATDWRAVACGSTFTMAVKTSNQLWGWGNNGNGQLGIASTTQQNSPVRVGAASDWSSVRCGNAYAVGLKTTGLLWAWGFNSSGQLGDNTVTQRTSPVLVNADRTWTAISCGNSHTAACKSDGSLWIWGNNSQGQAADGTFINVLLPKRVGTAVDWTSVSAGNTHTVALRSEGSVWAAGNSSGLSGVSPRGLSLATTLSGTWTRMTSGSAVSHMLKSDGTIWGWGNTVGDGTTSDRRILTQVGTATDWQTMSENSIGSFVLALKTDNSLWAWGTNSNGQLGDNSLTQRTAPVQIGSETTWSKVSAGGNHSLAVKADGTLWSWGANASGQLGDGTTTQRLVPAQVGTETDWAAVCAMDVASLAIKTNGTLWAWGSNSNGRLGDGTTTQRNVPVQIGTDTNWAKLSGRAHVLALKTDGTLWSWGYGGFGQLGSGILGDRSLPVQVGTDTNWTDISAGVEFSLALKADGTLWSCGRGYLGQLGNGSTATLSTFTQLGTDQKWQLIGAGNVHSMALRSDGTLWGAGLSANARNYNTNRIGTVMAPVLPVLQPQTVTAPATTSIHDAPLQITTSSGLVPRVEWVSGPATVSGAAVTPTGLGSVVLSVSQSGDEAAWNAIVPTLVTVGINNALNLNFTGTGTPGITQDGFDATTSGLTLTLGFAPTVGNVLTLVNNTGMGAINGIFPGRAQGSYVTASFGGNAYAFQLSYTGGDGNDITLTYIEPAEIAVEQPAGADRADGSTLAFGDQVVGASVTKTFLIRNTGTGTLEITGVTKDGANAADFTLGTVSTTSIAPGGTATLEVTFAPTGTGFRTAAVHVLSSDADEGSFDLNVLGIGSALSGPMQLMRDINPVLGNSSTPSAGAVMNGIYYFVATDATNGTELWRSDGSAAGTFVLRDIFPGTTNSGVTNLGVVGSTLFFTASDSTANGNELWKSDGTTAGTVMVLNINPIANGSSSPANLFAIGSTLYFTATDGTNGTELWKSDGSAGGTVMVKDITAGSGSSSPLVLTNVNGTLFFSASDGTNGRELWKSDGTAGGTVLVSNIAAGNLNSTPISLIGIGSTLYFTADDGVHGQELWKSDGTSGGTVLLKDIEPGAGGSGVTTSAVHSNLNGTLIFRAGDSTTGHELWISDGTEAGTELLIDLRPGAESSLPQNFRVYNGKFYFTANDGTSGFELWQSDGTALGTVRVKDINPGIGSAQIGNNIPIVGTTLYFGANDGINGLELWKSDGTASGTVLVKDIHPGSASSNTNNIVTVGSAVFFSAYDGINGTELWYSDGTAAGTRMVKDGNTGLGTQTVSTSPTNLRAVNGKLFFSANDGTLGAEPWLSDGTSAGTTMLADLNIGPASSSPGAGVLIGSTLYFAALDAVGTELWKTDGTAAGTARVADIYSGPTGGAPASLVNFNGTLFFAATDGARGQELWKSDGTAAGTVSLGDLNPGGVSSAPTNFNVVGTTLFFTATTAAEGNELWKTDGSTASLVMNINPGSANSSPTSFVIVGSNLFFLATTAANGQELWKTDGTSTTMMADINPGVANGTITQLATANGLLFFSANDGVNGAEPWVSDGTPAGTVMLKDIHTTTATGSSVSNMVALGSSVFFTATDLVNGNELWTSDGTPAGTMVFKDINPGLSSSSPGSFVNISGTLYFSANDGVDGTELWKSDGTVDGTVKVKDLYPTASSSPTGFFAAGGMVYFRATTAAHGQELWRTDGTAAGTVLVADVATGTTGASPTNFLVAGNSLFFTASANGVGTELWSVDLAAQPELAVFEGVDASGAERQDNSGLYNFGALSGATTRSFTLKNNGSGSLYVSDIVLTGPQSGSFIVLAKPDPLLPILPGTTVTFTVTATLAGPPVQSATFEIVCNDADEPNFAVALRATVVDSVPPVISAPATYLVGQNGALTMPMPDVRQIVIYTDNLGGSGTITQSPAPGVGTLSIGQTQVVSFTATDASGNTSNSVSTTLTMGVGQPDTGNVAWAVSGGGVGSDAPNATYEPVRVVALQDGGVVVTGVFNASPFTLGTGADAVTLTSVGFADVFIARYRADGTLAWARSGGSTNNDNVKAVCVLADGSIVVSGAYSTAITFEATTVTTSANNDFFLVRYLTDGTLSWLKGYSGGGNTELVSNIVQLTDGRLALAGIYNSLTLSFGNGVSITNVAATNTDFFVAKVDPADGTALWARAIGSATAEAGNGVLASALPDGGLAIAAPFISPVLAFTGSATTLIRAGSNDWMVAKYDTNGALQWAKAAGGTGSDVPQSMQVLSDGDVAVYGTVASTTAIFGVGEAGPVSLPSIGGTDAALARFSGTDGTLLWAKRFGSAGTEAVPYLYGLGLLPDGSLTVTGTFAATIGRFGIGEAGQTLLAGASSNNDVYIARMNGTDGSLIWVKSAGGLFSESVAGLALLADGNIGVTGLFRSLTATFGAGEGGQTLLSNAAGVANVTDDMFFARYDFDDGHLLGVKRSGGVGSETVQSVAVLPSGSAVVAGSYQPLNASFGVGELQETTLLNADAAGTNTDLYVVRFDTGGVQPATAPVVTTLPVTNLSSTSFTFNASIDPRGTATTVVIDYGPTNAYGTTFTAPAITAGLSAVTRSITFTDMLPSSMLHLRVRATNALGTTTGEDVEVTTYSAAEIVVEQPTGTDLIGGVSVTDFGAVTVGNSLAKTFTIRNVGTEDLTGLALSIDGVAASDYVVGALGVTSLPPGTDTSFTVTYTPSANGLREARLRIASIDGDEGTFEIMLTGTNLLAVNLASAGAAGVTANGYTVPAGRGLGLTLGFAPTPGSGLMVINNTAPTNAISGTFVGLPQGGTISASFGGQTYVFQANYAGGDGNDLVLAESFEWTWLGGSNVANVNGIYGTQGVAAAGNVPGSRNDAMTWQDAQGNLWLLGGFGYPASSNGYLNDLWKYNRSTGQWTWLKGSSAINPNGTYGTLGTAEAANTPGGRSRAARWVDAAGQLWLFGGFGYPATGTTTGLLNDLWRYDPATNLWTWMAGSNAINANGSYGTQGTGSTLNIPGARQGTGTWIDPSGKLWLFGGNGYTSSGTTTGNLNDLWKFDPVAGTWAWMTGSSTNTGFNGTYGTKGVPAANNTPGTRNLASTWVDAAGALWLFGGNGNGSNMGGNLGDLWRYQPGTNQWAWMSGTATVGVGFSPNGVYDTQSAPAAANTPGYRQGAVTWTDLQGRLWLFGGNGFGRLGATTGDLNDLWYFDTALNQWAWMRGPQSVQFNGVYGSLGVASNTNQPGARYLSTAFTGTGPSRDLFLFGGLGYAATGSFEVRLNDLWKLDLPKMPTVSTLAASGITSLTATLNASVTANESATTLRFLFGTSPTLSGATYTTGQAAGSSAAAVSLAEVVSGLTYSTTYYFRAVAISAEGTSLGAILSFVTPNAPDISLEQPAGTPLTDGNATVNIGAALATQTVSKSFTLRNTGTATLSGLTASVVGNHAGNFTVGNLISSVALGASTTFTVSFSPTFVGAHSAILQIDSNDPEEAPFDVMLSGAGLTPDASLSALTLSSGSLSPSFENAVTDYAATVSSAATSITVRPTALQTTSSIQVNGANVASGANSASIPLVIGPNTITVLVTAVNGSVTKTYNLVVTRPPSADLVVTVVTPPPASVDTDVLFDVSWSVLNQGTVATAGSWTDKVYLSTDANLGGDVLLGSFRFSAVIPAGQTAARTQTVLIPRSGTTAGTYRLIVVADADTELPEGVNEGNNWTASTATFGVTLPPLPDLTVQSPISAPSTVLTGQTITVSWTIRNAGGGSTNTASWFDQVFLSTDTNPDGADTWRTESLNVSYLGAGDTYNFTQSLKVPIGLTPGAYHIIVKTDSRGLGQVLEDSEANNTLTKPVTINMTPPPDLRVTNAVVPLNAYAGTSIPLNFTVLNDGAGPVPPEQNAWKERVWLSTNTTLEELTDTFVTNIDRSGALAADESYSRTGYSITIPSGTASGTYYVIVETDRNKVVFEHTGEGNNTRATGAIQIEQAPQPDLVVAEVSVPEIAPAGQPMPVTWIVTNDGAGSANAGWSDYIYLSTDNVLNTSVDTLLRTVGRPNTLASGASYTQNTTVTLPDRISGTGYYLFVITDGGGSLAEFDPNHNAETNNTRISETPFEITYSPPDLVVASVSTSTATALAGQQITVNWTVTNQGAGVTKPTAWSDQVYFSTDTIFNPATDTPMGTYGNGSSLNGGQSYNKSATLTLDACGSGTFYVFVRTDSSSQVYEAADGFDAETNNTFVTPAQITITSNPADLQVTTVTPPSSGIAGQFVSVTWTVANSGTGLTNTAGWSDRVYLSTSPTFSTGTATQVGTFARSGVLAATASYLNTQPVQLPLTFSGNYYVYVTTDIGNGVQECTAETNNDLRSAGTMEVISMPPDLQIVSGSISATPTAVNSGQSISVSWSVSNSGTGTTAATNWLDRVYLSTSTVFNVATATPLGFVARNGALEVNASYTATGSFAIPRTMQGQRYLFVVTDADGAVFEGPSDGNNTSYSATPLSITLSPYPDLEIMPDSVTAPSTGSAGLPVSVAWTVSNPGAAATGNVSWTDYAYVSRDQVFDSTDPQLGFVARSGGLAVAGSYTQNSTFTLPAGISGTHYIIVVTDRNDALVESDEFNNTLSSSVMNVQTPPPADLRVASVTPPATGTPGQPAVITWSVTNVGSNPANGTWSDAVYLSTDDVWDINDALVDRVNRTGPLAPSASYTGTSTAVLPGVLPGSYRVIIRTDIRNNVLEGAEGNNTGSSTNSIAIDATALTLGTPHANQLTTGSQHYFKVFVSAGEDLRIVLDSASPDSSNELFVRYGAVPDRGNYDFLYPSPFSPDQVITVPTTQAGWYYILVRGDQVTGSFATYTLTASLELYGIRALSPVRGGNGGRLTLTLTGGRYTEGATATLFRAGYPDIVAENVTRVSSTTVRARFNLNAAELGLWSLRLDTPGAGRGIATQVDALTIEEAVSAPVEIRIDGPDLVKQDTRGLYTAYVTNNSNNDIERMLLRLRAPAAQVGALTSALTSQYAQTVALRPDADGMVTFTAVTGDIGPGEISRGLPLTLYPVGGLAEGLVPLEANARVLSYEQLDAALAAAVDAQISAAQAAPTLDPLVRQVVEERAWWLSTVLPAAAAALPADLLGEYGWSSPLDLMLNLAVTHGCARPGGLCPAYTALRSGSGVPESLHSAWKLRPEFGDTFPVTDHFKNITIVSALDPNEKLGSDGYGTAKFIGNQQPISYTVFFENVSTATAAAHLVTVEDTLDSRFNPNSFKVQSIEFGDVRITAPGNSSFYQGRVTMGPRFGNVAADVSVGVVKVGLQSVIRLTIRAVDPATGEEPESPAFGVLLPNNELRDGEGSITFTLQTRTNASNVITGAPITNEAVIVFDSNESIRTNIVRNTLDAAAPNSKVTTLASVQENTSFTVSWSGTDDKDGSGLRNYDVFYSANKGTWVKWLGGVTYKSSNFTNAIRGAEYRFYSLARDNAGNIEKVQLQAGTTNINPDTTTVVSSGPNTPPVLAAITDRTGVVGQLLTLTATATDTDIPANTFTYSLTGSVPAGAQIGASTGLFTWTPLPSQAPGTYVINVQLADNGVPALTATRSFSVDVRTNLNPIAGADTAGTTQSKAVSISVAKLMRNDTDPDGDILTLSLGGVTTSNNGSILLSGGNVIYTPPVGFHGTDTFTYTLFDGYGGSASSTVTVTVAAAFAATANPIVLTTLAGGARRLSMVGIPGRTYRIEYSSDLSSWLTLGTRTAGSNGHFTIDDPGAAGAGSRFYRLAAP
jgi:ELWxxDGT repeat protein